MGLEFLARVRRSTAWLAAVAALFVAVYRAPAEGLALSLGAAWSLANLFLIEKLVVALTGPDRGKAGALRRAVLAVVGMGALFTVGAVLLMRLPPATLLWGFLAPFVVIVLKAAALLLLSSRWWRRFARDPRGSTGLLVALALAAWVAAPFMARATSEPGAPAPATQSTAPASAQHGVAAPAGQHGAHEGSEASEGPQKFANVITVLSRAFPDAAWAHFLHRNEVIVFSLFVAFLICLIAWLASRNARIHPGPLQNAVEMLVETLHDFLVGILGPKHGPRFVPFLGTLFIYILAMNLFGLIPFMDSPTSSLNVTVALALVVFVYAQYIGIRELGVIGYVDHLAGSPRTLIGWLLVPLMLPIHVMGELAKPISLSCRLFGNIFGEDMLLVAFATLGITVLGFTKLPLGIPLQLPFLFLALLTSTLQALVFTVLSTIYFLLMLPHEEHGHEEVQHAH